MSVPCLLGMLSVPLLPPLPGHPSPVAPHPVTQFQTIYHEPFFTIYHIFLFFYFDILEFLGCELHDDHPFYLLVGYSIHFIASK
jgi:hypothetical protein